MSNISELRTVKKAEAQARIQARIERAAIARANNERLMDLEVTRELRQANITSLTTMMDELNLIHSVKLPQIGEVKVNCFPVAERYFGTELSLLLGVLAATRQTYLEDQREQALAITNLDMATVEDVSMALGETAYYSKKTNKATTGILGSYELAKDLLEDLADKMGLGPIDMTRFTEAKYNLWFENTQKAADSKEAEFLKSLEIDATSDFTLK